MEICIIAAVSANNVLGRDNALVWHIPEDLKYFKKTTFGWPVIMGRRNFQAIGKSLPGRMNIIISRNRDFQAPGCSTVYSIEEALRLAGEEKKERVFIIGGGEIYRQTLSLADYVYLTRIHADFEGDVFFPELDSSWMEIQREERPDAKPWPLSFIVYKKS